MGGGDTPGGDSVVVGRVLWRPMPHLRAIAIEAAARGPRRPLHRPFILTSPAEEVLSAAERMLRPAARP